jgi:hypothetical protein
MYGISNKLMDKLDRIVRACFRTIEKKGKYEQITMEMKASEILTVRQRAFLRVALIVHTCLKLSAPCYLADMLLPQYPSTRVLRSSTQHLLAPPRTRTEIGKRSFSVSGANVWNILPDGIRNIGSHLGFRKKVEEYLLSCDD